MFVLFGSLGLRDRGVMLQDYPVKGFNVPLILCSN